MKRAIGLPATTARARRKKRGFSSELAANAAGHIHVPGAALECRSFMLRGRAQRDGKLASLSERAGGWKSLTHDCGFTQLFAATVRLAQDGGNAAAAGAPVGRQRAAVNIVSTQLAYRS